MTRLGPFALLATAVFFATGVSALLTPGRAWAWDPFARENPDVARGNEALRAGDAEGALAAYETAARTLPGEPGVHLNRGLAMLANGNVAGARDALRIAASPDTPPELRADALYDLGLTFLDGAEARAGEEAHDEAQQLFREAADAFRGSLRARPGDRDTAWNLELALRRLQEEQEKQRQKEAQDAQEQDEDPQDEQEQEPDTQEQEPDEPPQDPSPDAQEQQQDPDAPAQEPDEPQQDPDAPQQEQRPDAEGQEPEPPPDPGEGEDPSEPSDPEDDGLPRDVARVLDALREDEQSLERERAAARARQERRRPTKDW